MALIKHQRYAHARQFKRAGKVLRKLKTYLGRMIRDIARKIARNKLLKPVFAKALSLSHRVLTQQRRQKAPKVYSLHAPEVECIGKGKAHKPYEFGVKVSLATTLSPSARSPEVSPKENGARLWKPFKTPISRRLCAGLRIRPSGAMRFRPHLGGGGRRCHGEPVSNRNARFAPRRRAIGAKPEI